MAILVLSRSKRDIFQTVMRALNTLGIDAEHGLLVGTGGTSFQTPRGTMTPTGSGVRDFLKQYDAIFIFERRDVNETDAGFDAALNLWLTWNNADDPPIVYFAPNLSTARTTLNLPTNFPIIRPDPTDLANTAALIDAGIFNTVSVEGGGTVYTRLGACIDLTREDARIYTPTLCAFLSTNGYFWRLDTTKHAALGQDGEILAIPNFPDKTFPNNTIAAYRYYNRYFLPMFCESIDYHIHIRNIFRNGTFTFFWLLYALKLCGIRPKHEAVLCFEIDHPIVTRDETMRADGLTKPQQLDILYATYQYLAEFHRRTELVVPCGVETGGRSGRGYWYYGHITDSNPDIRQRALAIHQLLLKEHAAALPCGVHDHSAQPSKESTTYNRIGNNEHPYAAPNDVPVAPGACINKRIMPNPPAGARDYGEFWDLGPTVMSGTSTTVSKPAIWNHYTARMNLYDQVNEMKRLGFPDGHCGIHRYTNCPSNETGGMPWWDAYLELGFRGLRATTYSAIETTYRQTHPSTYHYNGLWFVPSLIVEWNTTPFASVGSYGLYRPDVPDGTHAVGTWALDVSGDINSDYTTNANTRWKAYRRMIGLSTGIWRRAALFRRGTVYLHPPSWLGADPSNPLAIVDTGSDLKLNPMVEMLEAMAVIQSVLSDYIKFGSPTDVMDLLSKIGVFEGVFER